MASSTSGNVNTVVFAVVASTFFVGFGGGVVFPILPNLGAVLGISAFMVGVILSASRFTRLLANAPAGALVDRYGTRKPFVAGLGVQAIATLGYIVALLVPMPEDIVWLAHGLPEPAPLDSEHWLLVLHAITASETWFLLARLLWGAGSASIMATAYTIVTNVSPQDSRGTYMGVVRGGLLLGFPSGLVLGGVVSGIAGELVAFGLSTVFAVVATIVAFILVPETHVVEDVDRSIKPWEIETAIPALTVGFVNCALMFAYAGTLFATLVLFLDARSIFLFGLGAQGSSGIFMAGTVLSAGGAMVVGGWVSDTQRSRVPVLIVFLAMAVIGFILLARTDSLLELVAACLCIGVGQGGTSGPMIALLADLMPEDRMGRAAGTNNVLGDVGGVIGPIVSLPLVELVGFSPIYLFSALMPFLAGLILLVGVRMETGSVVPRSILAD